MGVSMNHPLKLGVVGSLGRMGRRVCALARENPRFSLAAPIERKNFGQTNWPGLDVLIDFSIPKTSLTVLKIAVAEKIPLVIGVTGFSNSQMSQIKAASRKIPIFLSPNFSPGIFWMERLAQEAAGALSNYDLSILETHHKAKKDAPSGTAKALASVLGRKVEILSSRVGDVVGEHTLVLAGSFERLEIKHLAHSRDVFAKGALDAAAWIYSQRPGLYGMEDLFGKNGKN